MTVRSFGIFPRNDPEQELRLKRLFMAVGAYLMNSIFVLACWTMDYFSSEVVARYLVLSIAINFIAYIAIRTGWNKRFADPSLTFAQMIAATLSVFYLMYHAGAARSIFPLLVLTMLLFGMFRFKTRNFAYLTAFILAGYAVLIVLLLRFRVDQINLKIEVLQWMALLVTLGQFTVLAGHIGKLRRQVHENNQALAKQNTELETALQHIGDMAVRDELTGVYNRRYLTERIAEEALRCQRNGSAFCICVVDLDLFKQINDSYGHLAGDAVLRTVAMIASRTLRQTDFFGRFGGEEFVMVLTDTHAEGALVTAERVREKIAQLRFPEINLGLSITVSIGIAEHNRKTEPTATFQSADEALYRAKKSGRNRCVLAASDQGNAQPS